MHQKYKRMLNIMKRKEQDAEQSPPTGTWFLYILKCKDGTFYTGVTNNLEKRLQMHNEGKASRYTRSRRPVKLLYHEGCASRTKALVRECTVKALARKKKEELISKS